MQCRPLTQTEMNSVQPKSDPANAAHGEAFPSLGAHRENLIVAGNTIHSELSHLPEVAAIAKEGLCPLSDQEQNTFAHCEIFSV